MVALGSASWVAMVPSPEFIWAGMVALGSAICGKGVAPDAASSALAKWHWVQPAESRLWHAGLWAGRVASGSTTWVATVPPDRQQAGHPWWHRDRKPARSAVSFSRNCWNRRNGRCIMLGLGSHIRRQRGIWIETTGSSAPAWGINLNRQLISQAAPASITWTEPAGCRPTLQPQVGIVSSQSLVDDAPAHTA